MTRYRRPHKTSVEERLRILKAAGFDRSVRLSSGAVMPLCSGCVAAYVDGVPRHEATCVKALTGGRDIR